MDEPVAIGRASDVSADAGGAVVYAERFAAVCSGVLGKRLGSVILHGSLVLGGYTPGMSDIDLLAIVDAPLSPRVSTALVDATLAELADAPCRVDLRVVTASVAVTPPEVPPMELYVGLDSCGRLEVVRRDPGEPDLIVEFSLCRQCGRALIGAAPREAIGEVPDRWVLQVGDAQLASWQSLTDDAQNAALMVLTACRIWRFSEEHRYCSKIAAGESALTLDPSLQAVRGALRQRAGEPVRIEPAAIGHVLTRARAERGRRHDLPAGQRGLTMPPAGPADAGVTGWERLARAGGSPPPDSAG